MPSTINDELRMTNDEWTHTARNPVGPAVPNSRFSTSHLSRMVQFVIRHSSFVILFLFSALAADLAPAGWPMFRGSPSLTGATDVDLPKPLKLRWEFPGKGFHRILCSHLRRPGVRRIDGQFPLCRRSCHRQDALALCHSRTRPGILALRRNGMVYVGDLERHSPRGRCGNGEGPMDIQGRKRNQIIAQLRRRPGLFRVLRPESLLPLRQNRRPDMEIHHGRPGALHSCPRPRPRLRFRVR